MEANNGNSGCYDLRCPGSVQVSPKSYLGLEILNQSTYGRLRYLVTFQVRQVTLQYYMYLENFLSMEFLSDI